jgi:hypothetical protein
MNFDLNDFFDSLRHDRFNVDNPTIPAGLVDLSRIIDRIIDVMRDGRMLRSNHPYASADFIVNRVKYLVGDPTQEQSQVDTIVALLVIISLMLQTSARMPGDVAPEEFLMESLDETVLCKLKDEFRSTPTVFTSEGRLRPNFCALSPFQTISPITLSMLSGFMKRHLTSNLPHLLTAADEHPSESFTRFVAESDFEIIPTEDLPADTMGDPLNGFDEFHDHFEATDYSDYEDGEDLDED